MKLMDDYKSTTGILIAHANCSSLVGSPVCERFKLTEHPTLYYGTETVTPPRADIDAKKDAVGLPSTIWDGSHFKKGDVGQGYFLGNNNFCDVRIFWPRTTEITMVSCTGAPKVEPRTPQPPFADWFAGTPSGVNPETSLRQYTGGRDHSTLENFAKVNLGPPTPSGPTSASEKEVVQALV